MLPPPENHTYNLCRDQGLTLLNGCILCRPDILGASPSFPPHPRPPGAPSPLCPSLNHLAYWLQPCRPGILDFRWRPKGLRSCKQLWARLLRNQPAGTTPLWAFHHSGQSRLGSSQTPRPGPSLQVGVSLQQTVFTKIGLRPLESLRANFRNTSTDV